MPEQQYNPGDRIVLRPLEECEERNIGIIACMLPSFELPYVTLREYYTRPNRHWTIEEDLGRYAYDESWFAGRYPLSSSSGRKPNPLCLIGKLVAAERGIKESTHA